MIQHLKERNVRANRSKSVTEIPIVSAATAKDMPDRVSVVIANFRQRGTSRARKVSTLTSTIDAMFHKKLSDEEIAAMIDKSQARRFVTIDGIKLTYEHSEHDA